MDSHLHREAHFQSSDLVRDVVIGMADGLTVPFALAAGISGAVASVSTVIAAGVAEIAAGAIAMGLGGYLAARSQAEHYAAELAREELEIVEKPLAEEAEVAEIFEHYGLKSEHYLGVIQGLRQRPIAWRDFMMRFELGLERPEPERAQRSALTIGASYVVGGAVPLAPYAVLHSVEQALPWSAAVTLAALAVFGFVKARYTGAAPLRSALQTMSIGGMAAAAAFALARAVS
ncbi:MAG TPA: VIT1/CCC1 transporter family protein [Burkholderiaceae bacterium]|nr:VIT1/CCC1 transporter family protein [Burkholderiaceae bacterium]